MEDEQVRLLQMMALLQVLVVEQLGLADLALPFPSPPTSKQNKLIKNFLSPSSLCKRAFLLSLEVSNSRNLREREREILKKLWVTRSGKYGRGAWGDVLRSLKFQFDHAFECNIPDGATPTPTPTPTREAAECILSVIWYPRHVDNYDGATPTPSIEAAECNLVRFKTEPAWPHPFKTEIWAWFV